jgi:hypothetical protein
MKKLTGVLLVAVITGAIFAALALPAFAATSNTGGVVVESGDAPDCVGGSCGGVIVEDPAGAGPDCTGGNCGGSVCQGTDCGSCADGNCGGSISGPGTAADHGKKMDAPAKASHGAKALPRTGIPTAATLALGAGMILVGLFFTFVEHPSTKVAMASLAYRPKRRL